MAVILIIDDTDMVRDLLQRSLERVGHDVRAAKDGLEELRVFNEFPPDVVITDILMPDCDGIEVIQALRKQRPGLKILAISGADGAMISCGLPSLSGPRAPCTNLFSFPRS